MKRIHIFIFTVIFAGCDEEHNQNEVKEYMGKIKSETYADLFLPDFEPEHISSLLNYRNDKSIIEKYPTNLISSFLCDSVTVGIIALWTIESIRVSELNGDTSKYNRFPSLNPALVDTSRIIQNKIVLQDSASIRYFNWWNKNSQPEERKINTNPLEGSNIAWR
ncbi:MAG: DUF4943 family protein [Bacteroidales bacterium]|nr:DUF4943 family protein [Bacteroidales bacterium]